jgi:RimJ/RimL family protein N-acetyltransferase
VIREAERLVRPLQTRRLILRGPALSDASAVTRALQPLAMSRWLGVVPHPYTARHARRFLSEAATGEASGGDICRVIVSRANPNVLIGVIGFRCEGDTLLSLGYWIAREHHGRGYAREAAKAMIDFGFTTRPVDAVVATVLPDNLPSRRVLKAAGLARQHRRVTMWCRAVGRKQSVLDFRLDRVTWARRRQMSTVEAIARYGLSPDTLRQGGGVAS